MKTKILTGIFLGLFLVTLIWFPWSYSRWVHDETMAPCSEYMVPATAYCFVGSPPEVMAKPIWLVIVAEWSSLMIGYGALLYWFHKKPSPTFPAPENFAMN